jgi:predicted Zn-dependent peptidase
LSYFAVFMEQLMALGIAPGNSDFAAKAFADLKAELEKEKAAWEIAQCSWSETLNWPLSYFAVFMEQLMALGIAPGNSDFAAKAFADLKAELEKEKAAWEIVQIEVDTLTRAVEGLKLSVDNFAAKA